MGVVAWIGMGAISDETQTGMRTAQVCCVLAWGYPASVATRLACGSGFVLAKWWFRFEPGGDGCVREDGADYGALRRLESYVAAARGFRLSPGL